MRFRFNKSDMVFSCYDCGEILIIPRHKYAENNYNGRSSPNDYQGNAPICDKCLIAFLNKCHRDPNLIIVDDGKNIYVKEKYHRGD